MTRTLKPATLMAAARALAWFKRSVLAPLWQIVDRAEARFGQRSNDLTALYAARWDACAKCPFLNRSVPGMESCTKCGCLMRVKTQLEGATCPIGKW